MIFFGHLGITTGVFKASEKIHKTSIDYRMVLVGSILPDIIDKPIGAVIFRSTFQNSRIFMHSLLISLVLLVLGLSYLRRNNNIFILGVSCTIHLILDSMWLYPGILFWPLFGINFPVRPEGDWIASDIARLISDPTYYGPEIIGLIILAYYFIKLLKEKRLMSFIKFGKL